MNLQCLINYIEMQAWLIANEMEDKKQIEEAIVALVVECVSEITKER